MKLFSVLSIVIAGVSATPVAGLMRSGPSHGLDCADGYEDCLRYANSIWEHEACKLALRTCIHPDEDDRKGGTSGQIRLTDSNYSCQSECHERARECKEAARDSGKMEKWAKEYWCDANAAFCLTGCDDQVR